ncbi:amidophosphoribosyltransferase [Flavobacteriales bacterium]|jgi:amidophosphoribosyltransferase|nr:amidophosphoribosyltransferase [Flavobacteriales bacterium]MDB2675201.1 amidophosphoribosyltransferase [Flavobacteriales bacterium]
MSDAIKHECGIAFLRLRKPLEFYAEKYGSPLYGINKMCLLMEKQHNRGQDGAGLATIKLDVPVGSRYISRHRSNASKPIQDLFDYVNQRFVNLQQNDPEKFKDIQWLQENLAFTGEVLLGHLRYGTYGGNSIEHCHPFLRQNNWRTRSLVLAGNFNMTNVDELFNQLVELGQHPKEKADTVTILERIGHFLDVENDRIYYDQREQYSKKEISSVIADEMDMKEVLVNSSKHWDGGYVMSGIVGHGDAFVLRDPAGIRPAYYYADDEVVVATSERPVIQTAFNVPVESIKELKPGHALIIKKDGSFEEVSIIPELERKACSFERIYFSRGNDQDIYKERMRLGLKLCPTILDCINYDLKNTVFSFIPNTAEVSFYGMMKGMNSALNEEKTKAILALESPTQEAIKDIMSANIRAEKIAIKDAKLRTFITQDDSRDDLVAHVYDVTYGTVKPTDNLVMIDDSIVRGTTLKQSILRILDRLNPKKIVIVSSAPQIRYPDCYGIDMAKLGDFIAFQAAIALLKESGQEGLIDEVYQKCLADLALPTSESVNHVQAIYKPFSADQISEKIAHLLRPQDINAEVNIIYQTIEDLHDSCPNNTGDWYFTGDYPTVGGNRVVNKSFVYYVEGRNQRAY